MTELSLSVPTELGLLDQSQWEVISSIGENGLRQEKHCLDPKITRAILEKSPGLLNFAEATVAIKSFLNSHGKETELRLITGSPNSQPGQVTLFERDKREQEKIQGYTFGPDFNSAEEAWQSLINEHHYQEIP